VDTYLLKAPAEDMARWKAKAAAQGVTFAAFIRSSLDGTPVSSAPLAQAVTGLAPSATVRKRRMYPCRHYVPAHKACHICDEPAHAE
jgi:hypothetical protein